MTDKKINIVNISLRVTEIMEKKPSSDIDLRTIEDAMNYRSEEEWWYYDYDSVKWIPAFCFDGTYTDDEAIATGRMIDRLVEDGEWFRLENEPGCGWEARVVANSDHPTIRHSSGTPVLSVALVLIDLHDRQEKVAKKRK